jgi:hypothetical protein
MINDNLGGNRSLMKKALTFSFQHISRREKCQVQDFYNTCRRRRQIIHAETCKAFQCKMRAEILRGLFFAILW